MSNIMEEQYPSFHKKSPIEGWFSPVGTGNFAQSMVY